MARVVSASRGSSSRLCMCSKVITLLLKHVVSVSWFSLQLACTCTEYSNPCPTRNQCIRRPLYPIPSRNCKNIRRDESPVGHTSGATRLVSPLRSNSKGQLKSMSGKDYPPSVESRVTRNTTSLTDRVPCVRVVDGQVSNNRG